MPRDAPYQLPPLRTRTDHRPLLQINKDLHEYLAPQLPIFGGEDKERALVGHGSGLFGAATDGRTLWHFSIVSCIPVVHLGLLLIVIVLVGNGVTFIAVIATCNS